MCDELKKKTKIGIEITFSHYDFKYLNADKKTEYEKSSEFGEFCDKQFGIKLKKPSFDRYIDDLYKRYIGKWEKKIASTDMFDITTTKSKDLKGLKGSKNKQLTVKCVRKNKPTLSWSFDVDFDDNCIEIHAEPLTLENYKLFEPVITNQIYGIATSKEMGLKAGYSGSGGGHLSVDLETGFDNKPLNVLKTVLLFEVMQFKLDKCYDIIDVTDNTNAPYYFDSSRSEFQILNSFKIQQEDVKNVSKLKDIKFNPDPMEKRPDWLTSPENVYELRKGKIRRWFIAALSQFTKTNNVISGAWDNQLVNLATALKSATKKQLERKDLGDLFTSDKPTKLMNRLHYQGINLEHTCSTTKDSLRRVEFRRFVSQRDFTELEDAMICLLELIHKAKSMSSNFFNVELKTSIFTRIMTQSTMEKIEDLAKNES